ncbi:MAG TPA: hypothetical protein VNP73_12265 [Actinomycetota bacterium]|nr:hypothetical protein [Actinomycetota bacterium]
MQAEESNRGLSPIRAFLILLGVLAAVTAVVLLTRPTESVPAPGSPAGAVDHSLTNAEALARLSDLQRLERQAFAETDASLLSQVYTSTSPLLKDARNGLKKLQKDNVAAVFERKQEELVVLVNESSVVRVRETSIFDIRFVSRDGSPVDQRGSADLQTTEWVLRFAGGQWLIDDAILRSSKPVSKDGQ